jgi:hypothetical protein
VEILVSETLRKRFPGKTDLHTMGFVQFSDTSVYFRSRKASADALPLLGDDAAAISNVDDNSDRNACSSGAGNTAAGAADDTTAAAGIGIAEAALLLGWSYKLRLVAEQCSAVQ